MASSRQSHRASNAPRLSPSASTSPIETDRDLLLSASNISIQSSLQSLNNYIQKHYDRLVVHESLKRTLLTDSFTEKEKDYEKQIASLKAIHTDIAGLLSREQATNVELCQKLDYATGSMVMFCKAVTDAGFMFFDREQTPHGIKQEEGTQEIMGTPDVIICPDAAATAILSQIGSVVADLNAQNGSSLPSPVDSSPCRSITETLAKVADSLLTTQSTFVSLQGNLKSVDADRVVAESRNETLQEKIALLQEKLKQARNDNERISQELDAARLERDNHVCKPPAIAYPAPVPQDEFPVSLPSPPLEKLDLPIPDDILQETSKISRMINQVLPRREPSENAPITPQAPAVEAGPSSALKSADCERRRMSLNDLVKRVQANSTSTTTRTGPLKSSIVHDNQPTAGPSTLPPSAPAQGVKRTSSGVHKCQGVSQGPPSSLSASSSLMSSTSEKANSLHTQKKRRMTGTSDTPAVSQKHKPSDETPSKTATTTPASKPTAGPSSAPPSKVQLPKTNASDLKSLKFNKKSQPSKPSPILAATTPTRKPRPISTTMGPPMSPLDLAKKSPQERAALRKSM